MNPVNESSNHSTHVLALRTRLQSAAELSSLLGLVLSNIFSLNSTGCIFRQEYDNGTAIKHDLTSTNIH